MRIRYRFRQFWRALSIKEVHPDLETALAILTPAQKVLFSQMQPGEQRHAAMVYQRLRDHGENQPDLLVAALLHDVGKLRYRMHPLERAMVVLAKASLPKLARNWGRLPSSGWVELPAWRKAFILAENHAMWGADLARQAGVSPLAESLIRFHDQPHTQAVDELQTSLLHKLWLVDNES